MKKIILICIFVIFSSCRYKHFEFDTAEHYRIDTLDEKLQKIYDRRLYQENGALSSLLFDDYTSVNDKNLLANLSKVYPIKKKISESKIQELEQIYYDGINLTRSKCSPTYRDVLVFKKDDSIVGISKICFECNMQFTVDKYGYQKEFDNNDYDELKEILK